MTTKQIVLAARPNGTPILNDFRFEDIELDELQQGEVLLQGMYYSVDPYMRGRMNEGKSYVPPFELNKAIEGGVLATVLESKSDLFKTGDVVLGSLPWSEKMIASDKNLQKIESTVESLTYYLGILGMTGLTAYFGLMHIGKPKAGETVVVSGAAGAVGIVVGQIAKIHGARVIGIAGSDEKASLLKQEFGYDDVINYKTTGNIKNAIANLCPNGVDVYFDNVGGEISDAVIQNLNFHARIALCGQISLYNSTKIPLGPRIQPMLLTRSVLMQGFIISNFQKDFPEGIAQLSKWVNEGKLKFTETIIEGFDQLPAALLGLFKGENKGKMIVKA
ncbi:NADP-dependent oxidoreductase [Flavobacterium caseinilyticum]|uniref:NADP-dependent oxidoreductase n=1 Tax=Flavobacterium caseinilyticum TaxID=2541732 RepID=A0A4R5AXT9_9FLAO|nr:NADP-dependent oxidoreductase [Flavobacterium caseinilyticum]TDD76950.1 NADP-dependent oxidoreductase [Flavobacterium caseinilyticum]